MLNPHRLKNEFLIALQKSWHPNAIWPGCKDGYEHGVSHPSYGQCLVGTLATWAAHEGKDGSFIIVPGTLEGDNMPEGGVWHFQLAVMNPSETEIPVDVTWDQVQNGAFTPAENSPDPNLYKTIIQGSFPEDESLIARLDVILKNLKNNGYSVNTTAKEIVDNAYDSFDL